MSTKTMFDKLNQTIMALTIILSIFSTINATTINQNNQLGGGNEQQNQNNNIIGQEHSMIEQRTTSAEGEHNDFFRQYLNRGMFSCATKYVTILQKLNKLIVSAHQEYSQCKGQMREAEQNLQQSKKLRQQLDMINELFNDE